MTKTLIGLLLSACIVCAAGFSAGVPPRRDIQGGSEADPLTYPSVVRVRHIGVATCNGSLIADDWMLTALHCVDGADVREYTNIDSCISDVQVTHGGLQVYACEIVGHDLYDPFDDSTHAYDLALVRIKPFTARTVRPAGLIGEADSGLTAPGTSAVAVARSDENYGLTEVLKTATWPLRECPGEVPPGFLCAQADILVMAEVGDSGSPLLVERDGEWVQVGTLLRIGQGNQVIAYADLRLRAEWIRSVAGVSGDPETPGPTSPPGGTETTPEAEGACPVDSAPRVILEYRDGRWTVRTETLP